MTAKLYTLAEAQAHLASLSGPYASTVTGDCMDPIITDGTIAIFDPEQWPQRGDLACLWLEGRVPGSDEVRLVSWIKRITQSGWGKCKLPFQIEGDGNVVPLIGFESVNPDRHWTVDARKVYALHRFIGTAADHGLVSNGNGLLVKAPKRRKAAA